MHVADSRGGGGAELVFNQTVEAAIALGHETLVYVSGERRGPVGYVFSARALLSMARALRRFEPDIVHVQNYYHYLSPSILLALRRYKARRPDLLVVFSAHDFHLVCPNSGFQTFGGGTRTNLDPARPSVRLLARYDQRSWLHSSLKLLQHIVSYRLLRLHEVFDVVVAPGPFLAGVLSAAFPDLPVAVVRNPVPAQAPAAGVASRESSDRQLVFAGRLDPVKGLEECVGVLDDVAWSTPDGGPLRLDVYGDGPLRARLETIAGRLQNVAVRFHGHASRRALLFELSSYAACIAPSTCFETGALSLLDAASAGLPVVAPRMGAFVDAAAHCEIAYLYEPSSPDELRECVSRAVSDPRRNRLVDPDDLSFDRYIERLAAIYSRLTVAHRAAARLAVTG
jgi:glycosyltransferase involved in cell wall biosynthesis